MPNPLQQGRCLFRIRFVLSRVDKHSEYIKGAGEKGDIKNQAIGTVKCG